MSQPSFTPQAPPPHRQHYGPRIIVGSTVLAVVVWFSVGGYERMTAPKDGWQLPNGDTVEIITQNNEYTAGVQLQRGALVASHYFLIQFRSTLKDAARDKRDIHGIMQVVCAWADTMGYRRINIQPTRTSFFDLMKYGQDHWVTVDTGGHCRLDKDP